MEANVAAWMISGGRAAHEPAEDRNLRHLWVVRAAPELSRPAAPFRDRFPSLVSAIRPGPATTDPACCAA